MKVVRWTASIVAVAVACTSCDSASDRTHDAPGDSGSAATSGSPSLEDLVYWPEGAGPRRDLDADRAARGQRNHLVGREEPLLQNFEHFAAHIPCGADDGYAQTHFRSSSGGAIPRAPRAPPDRPIFRHFQGAETKDSVALAL